MQKEHKSVQDMWLKYLNIVGLEPDDKNYTSWHFCDNEESANDLAKLVKSGVKRATAGLYYWYEVEGEALPQKGDLSIITDWDGLAQCIIETKNVTVIPFKNVSEEFARTEGEGDKSLEYWRRVHIEFFTRELDELGKIFSEDMKVVCEEFEVVYK